MKQSSRRSRFLPVEVGKVEGTRAVIEAVPEHMTCFGGAPMLAAVEKKVGLVARLCKLLHDARKQNRVDHKAFDIVAQRVNQIAIGFADGNDCDWLRNDPGIVIGLDRLPGPDSAGASQETTCRFEMKAVDRKNLKAVRECLVDHFIEHQRRRPKKLELDLDGSMMKTYGSQEGSVYRGGKYKHTMYFPLKILCGDWLLASILRRGDQGEATTVLAELKMVVGKLRAKWPGLRIKVRLDSAFGSPALYEWLKKNRVAYEIGLRPTSVLDSYAKAFVEQAQAEFVKEFGEPRFLGKDGGQRAQAEHARIRGIEDPEQRMDEEKVFRRRRTRVVGEFCYKPDSWKFLKWEQWERVICRVDFTDTGAETHFVLVSCQYGVPQRIYEEEYCRRGNAEQVIGRFKQTALRLSAQSFCANQLRLTLYGIAYMLLMHLRDYTCKNLQRADINTLRKTLMLMPVVARQTERKLILEISEQHAHARVFLTTWRRLAA